MLQVARHSVVHNKVHLVIVRSNINQHKAGQQGNYGSIAGYTYIPQNSVARAPIVKNVCSSVPCGLEVDLGKNGVSVDLKKGSRSSKEWNKREKLIK